MDDVTWRHHIGPGGQAELLNIWGAATRARTRTALPTSDANSNIALLQRADLPAMAEVLEDTEVRSVGLGLEPPRVLPGASAAPGRRWLVVLAVDDYFYLELESEAVENTGRSATQAHIVGQLGNFVAESSLGWGQQR